MASESWYELVCQLCGVSFTTARLRRPDEPFEAGWARVGPGSFYFEKDPPRGDEGRDDSFKKECSRCTFPERKRWGDDGVMVAEHVAGPGCVSEEGYSGWRITVEEMEWCRRMVGLVPKGNDWKEEDDDEQWEREGGYFLSGTRDGLEERIGELDVLRHDLWKLEFSNGAGDPTRNYGVPPLHRPCFEIFKKVSMLRTGKVDVEGLWGWWTNDDVYTFPRHPAVKKCVDEGWCWNHIPGSEWLVANPVDISGFPNLILSQQSKLHDKLAFDQIVEQDSSAAITTTTDRAPPPNGLRATNHPFRKLPTELTTLILEYLPSKDIASLRLASAAFRSLPDPLFRKLLLKDMPWLWEARDLAIGVACWRDLYVSTKFCWIGWFKGLQNRRRIWGDVVVIVDRIERYRKEGKIGGRGEVDDARRSLLMEYL